MVHGARRFGGPSLGVALLLLVCLGTGAAAQEPRTEDFELTPSRGSGVSGTATLKNAEGGVEVTVDVEGLPEGGGEYVHHIHQDATCEEDKVDKGGPVEFPLNEVAAREDGTASATSFVEGVTLDQIVGGDKERYINFHPKPKKGGGVPPGITCTTLAPTTIGGVSSLPESGGTPPLAMLLGTTILATCATVCALLLLRRRAA